MEIMRLRHIATVTNSNVDKVIDPAEVPVRLCNYVHVYKNDFITTAMEFDNGSATEAEIKRFGLRVGDVIITKDSEDRHDIGVPAYVRNTADDLVCGYHLTVLRALPKKCRGDFLFWALQSKAAKEAFAVEASGITRYGLGQEGIKGLSLLLPDLASQKQIADFLDAETARIDALIEKKQRFHEIVVEREEASFLDAVTGRNLICDRQPSGVRWIGDLSSGWLAPKFTQVARQETGHTPSRKEPSYWIPEDCVIPCVSLADVWQLRSGEAVYLTDTAEKISAFGMANSSARLLPKDTVILSRTASVGFVAIMATDMATTQDFAAWIPGSKIRSKFLYYELRAMKPEFRRLMMGSTHQTIYMPDIRSFRTPLPPLPEQDRIIASLDASIGTYRQVNTKIQTSITRLREYRAALITAAVTGQIDLAAHSRLVETVLRRAVAEVVSLPLPLQHPARPDRRTFRVLVAAEVVHRLGAQPSLGRIKLQKLMFLAEAHANINEIDGRYERYRAGPYDGAMMPEIEAGLRQEQFYDAEQNATADRGRITFQRLPRAGDHRDAISAALGDKVASLRTMVDLFKDLNTEATEAVATLYAVWNDALIDGQQPDDAAIIRGFLQEWHKDKDKFRQADLQTWLGWMRRRGIVPRGAGPRTVSTSTPSLFESE